MTERVEILVIGAGPAGLRAAEVLADAGRDVLVLEKNHEVGPKVCAGGLTPKAQAIVDSLELPPGEGLVRPGKRRSAVENRSSLATNIAPSERYRAPSSAGTRLSALAGPVPRSAPACPPHALT